MFYETWHSSQDDGNAVWPARRAMLEAALASRVWYDPAGPGQKTAWPALTRGCQSPYRQKGGAVRPSTSSVTGTHNQLPDQGDQVSDAAKGGNLSRRKIIGVDLQQWDQSSKQELIIKHGV